MATTGKEPDRAARECVRRDGVQRLIFSATEYPNIQRHFRRAVARRGWPLRLTVNRPGADDERRERLLRDVPIRDGFDRDEYPPASDADGGRAWSAFECMDATERAPPLAAALADAVIARGWIEREPDSRTIHLTPTGSRALRTTLDLGLPPAPEKN